MFPSYRNGLIFLTFLMICFGLTTSHVFTVYAQAASINIDIHRIGEDNFTFGGLVSPSTENPLFFHFTSSGSLSYTCKIIKIDEELFNNIIDASNTLPATINLVGTEISTNDCGAGTDGSIQYAQSFASGFYAFEVIGFAGGGSGTESIWLFEVQGGQAGTGGPEAAAEVTINVNQFWQQCAAVTVGAANVNLEKIQYKIQGRAKIDNLKFDGSTLDLIIKTNTLNKDITGKLSSASTEDFKIKKLDTQCIYNLPERAGQSKETGGPTKGFSATTLAAWNPPVPQCDAKQFKREITYPFKVTSWIGKLKDANSRDVEINFVVDANPKNHLTVQGKITLDNSNTPSDIEIADEPGVKCSGETLVG